MVKNISSRRGLIQTWVSAVLALVLLCLTASTANAQAINRYTNTTGAAITDNNCTAGGLVTRTFVVGTSYTVADIDLGILISHTYRSDIRINLTSPLGTTATVLTWTGNVQDGDNYNDLFDDEAAASITTHDASVNDPTAAPGASYPYYSHAFRPSNPLSVFDGQNALGTWTMTICDGVGADTGSFIQADLFITSLPTNYADLSLTKTVSNASPTSGGTTDYTLTVTNSSSSTQAATVSVRDILPAGTSYNSTISGTGTYDSATGIWSVGSVPIGTARSIVIRVNVSATAGATIANIAEVFSSSVVDSDSTPNNGSTGEDDYASRSFTVSGTRTAGTPPVLSCSAGSSVFDWDAVSWTAGSTAGNYSVTNIGTINFGITNAGTWLSNATYGGQAPARQNVVTGGNTGQFSLFQLTDMANQSQEATTIITLPTAVPGAQFTIFDVDYAAGQFADRVTVTGSFNGSPVSPLLTNNTANYVIGNSAYGDQTSADAAPAGNVVATFTTPVDTISIAYGNHSLAPANPGQQAVSLHDITFCRPIATLSITKISNVVSDGVSGSNPKSIPGAIVRYCILVTNAGSGTATNVIAGDPLPGNISYMTGSMLSGSSCAGATTPEDEDTAGADESDSFGMSFAGTTVTGSATSLAPSGSMALVFNAMIN